MKRRKSAKARTHARSKAVTIPANPELDEHAAEIRKLARYALDDVIEIGERLDACHAILRQERRWLAWLKVEFSWSRRTAERFIVVFRNRGKVGNLRTLPMSAIYTLAEAPPERVRMIEQRVAAGEQLSGGEIRRLALGKDVTPASLNMSEPAPARPSLRTVEIDAALVKSFVQMFHDFTRQLERGGPAPEEVVKRLTVKECRALREAADAVATYVADLILCIEQTHTRPRLSLITGGDDDDKPAA
jgi:Protein of unknown function (DUF3102)